MATRRRLTSLPKRPSSRTSSITRASDPRRGRCVAQLGARLNGAFARAVEMCSPPRPRSVTEWGNQDSSRRRSPPPSLPPGRRRCTCHRRRRCTAIWPPGPRDLVLALSNSARPTRIVRLLPAIRRLGAPIVAMTSDAETRSRIARTRCWRSDRCPRPAPWGWLRPRPPWRCWPW